MARGRHKHRGLVDPNSTLFPELFKEFADNELKPSVPLDNPKPKQVFSGYLAPIGYIKQNAIEARGIIFQAQEGFRMAKGRMVLVVPTGMGKTYVAFHLINRHLMDNDRRVDLSSMNNAERYKFGPVLFIDWTEGLAKQQYEDAQKVFKDVTDIRFVTGAITPKERADKRIWNCADSGIIFATPETVINDYESGILDLKRFGFLVADEIHRARGNSAYAKLCRFFRDRNKKILGLTASIIDKEEDEKDVTLDGKNYFDEALKNSGIENILFYRETDNEVKKYTYKKEMKIVYCPLEGNILRANNYLVSAQRYLVNAMVKLHIISGKTKSGNRKDYVTEKELQSIEENKEVIAKRLNTTSKKIYNIVSAYRMYRMLISALQQESVVSFLSIMGNYIDYFCTSVWYVHSKYAEKAGWVTDEERKFMMNVARTGPEKPKKPRKPKKQSKTNTNSQISWLSEQAFKDKIDDIWSQNSFYGEKARMLMARGLTALMVVYEKRPIHKFLKFMKLMFEQKIEKKSDGSITYVPDFSKPKNYDKDRYYTPFYTLTNPKFLKCVYDVISIRERHPKLVKLIDILKQFDKDTRIIVFSKYVVNVDNILYLINKHPDIIRIGHKAERFVGHGSGTRKCKGMTRKHQREIMEGFKSGKFNILVTTSIGEEGYNYSADVAILMDQSSEARRLIQAPGRIGRDKDGVYYILMASLPSGNSMDETGFWVANWNKKGMMRRMDEIKVKKREYKSEEKEKERKKKQDVKQLSFNF